MVFDDVFMRSIIWVRDEEDIAYTHCATIFIFQIIYLVIIPSYILLHICCIHI
ncbi:hypothetical protein HanXRQr2_Chr04g0168211 [Helianthus annuus]|uniref:Uncharacterized protein n=1 Tax=Helianthus annuus TaxID=4232 RepID=A0A9K3NT15_HELAN|nr:hypothetical protein HanXRQr2_Chr04g0168211 [Helianthus annuus]KAJ0931459.1 hypothetical protein HanPSC8_Chr04g0161861 [Helianthus annuus]